MIAICIGHSRKISGRYDGGAYSEYLKINERDFNLKVAIKLSANLTRKGIPSQIFSNYAGDGYGTAMFNLSNQIRKAQATMAIELHFNSATPNANGHEWLYWFNSLNGASIAKNFENEFKRIFSGIKSRGTKMITRVNRGGKFLELTHCPAVILEPFFGSNESDCKQIDIEGLAAAYTNAIDSSVNPSGHKSFKFGVGEGSYINRK
jgi:N-acetylmuramoyl-L-alanine amidase